MTNCFDQCGVIAPLPIQNVQPLPMSRLLANMKYLALPEVRSVSRKLGSKAGKSCGTIQIQDPCPGQIVRLRFEIKNCRRPFRYDFTLNLAQIMPDCDPCVPSEMPSPDCIAKRLAQVLVHDSFLHNLITFTVTPVTGTNDKDGPVLLSMLVIEWESTQNRMGTLVVSQKAESMNSGLIPATIGLSSSGYPGEPAPKVVHGQPLFYNWEVDPTMERVFVWNKADAACLQFAGIAQECKRCNTWCDTPYLPFAVPQAETSMGFGYNHDSCPCCAIDSANGFDKEVAVIFDGNWVIPVFEKVQPAGSHHLAITDEGNWALIPSGSRAPAGVTDLKFEVKVMLQEDEKFAIRLN